MKTLSQQSGDSQASTLTLILKWLSKEDSEETKIFEMTLKKAEEQDEVFF